MKTTTTERVVTAATAAEFTIRFIPNDHGNPPGKLADAEIHFSAGVFEGLKLIGFSIWERRGGAGGCNVTFPARQYSVNGERRSFALLRPTGAESTIDGQSRIRDLILDAWRDHVAAAAGEWQTGIPYAGEARE